MRKTIFSTLLLCLSTTMAWAEQVVIETQHVSMVLDVVKGAQPQYVYFGLKAQCQRTAAPAET